MTDQVFPFKRNYSTSKSIQFSLRTGEFSELAATASQNLIGSAERERERERERRESTVATKLKYHRLKPGGVLKCKESRV
jgi:hypothetical protein